VIFIYLLLFVSYYGYFYSLGCRPTFVNNWKGELDGTDPRYASFLNIDWNQITNVLENLNDKDTYQGVGLLNFNDSEIDHWKQLVPEACSPSPELCF
jgi:xylan alpha-glucuronosyltransferase